MGQPHGASAPGRRQAVASTAAPAPPPLGADRALAQLRTLGESLQRQTALLEEQERLVCRSLPSPKIPKAVAIEEEPGITNPAAAPPALMRQSAAVQGSTTNPAAITGDPASAATAVATSSGGAATTPTAAAAAAAAGPARALAAANADLVKELAAAQRQAALRAAGDAARVRAIEAEAEALRAELRVALASIAEPPSVMAPPPPLPSLGLVSESRSYGMGAPRREPGGRQDPRERARVSAALALRDEAARIRQQVREAAAAVKRAHRQARERLDAMVAAQAAQVAELQQRAARPRQASAAAAAATAAPTAIGDGAVGGTPTAPAPAAAAAAPLVSTTTVAVPGSVKKASTTGAEPAADAEVGWTIPAVVGTSNAAVALFSSNTARSLATASPRSKVGAAALRLGGLARGGQLERAAVARRLLRKELRETQDNLHEAMEQRQAALARLEQLAASIRTRLPSSAGRLDTPPVAAAPGVAQQEDAAPALVHRAGPLLLAALQPATPQTLAAPPPPPLRSTLGSTVGSPLSPQPRTAERQSGGHSSGGGRGESRGAAAREVAAVREVVELQRAQLIELAERYGRLKLRHARLKGRVAGAVTAPSAGVVRRSAAGEAPCAAGWAAAAPAAAAVVTAGRRQGDADRAAAEWAAAATAAEESFGRAEWQSGAGAPPLLPWGLGARGAAPAEIQWRGREEEEEMIRAGDEWVRRRLRPLVVPAAASARGGASDGGASEQFYSCGGASEGGGGAASGGGGGACASEGGPGPALALAAAEC